MTKEEITPYQAMQYLNMLVALDNSQIANDLLKYFDNLQQENEKQKQILDILKSNYKKCIKRENDLIVGDMDLVDANDIYIKEWIEND